MILGVLLVSAGLLTPLDNPITLERLFAKGEKGTYKVASNLQIEARQRGSDTFMPEDLDINYNFTYEVTEMKPDGIALVRYKRPTMTEITGETYNSPPKSRTIKSNYDLLLTVSPINEIIEMKDLAKKDTKKDPKKGGGRVLSTSEAVTVARQISLQAFRQEIYRLSLFIGSLDSAMDFSPKLPFDEIKPGDTWQKTAGYSPQKLQGSEGKSAVQRLDYTYTYKGIVPSGANKVYRITASLNLDTDAAEFVNQLIGMKPEQSHLKEVRLKLAANIDYDLDLKTRRTLKAVATSTGGTSILITDFPDDPISEDRIKGRTVMTLLPTKP